MESDGKTGAMKEKIGTEKKNHLQTADGGKGKIINVNTEEAKNQKPEDCAKGQTEAIKSDCSS